MKNFFSKKRRIWNFLLLLLITVLGSVVLFRSKSNKEPKMNVISLGELQPKVDFYLVGSIEPNRTVEWKLDKNKGVITEKKVSIGDRVEVGQELFRYSNPEGELAIKEAEQAVINQQKMIEQRKLETSMKWGQYNKLLAQKKELEKKLGVVDEEKRDELKNRKDELDNQSDQFFLEAKELENSTMGASLELEKAQLELKNTQDKYGAAVVKTDTVGVVSEIDENQMNRGLFEKAPEKPFMTIVDTSQLFLRGTVDEFRRGQLKLEQRVKLLDRDSGKEVGTGKIIKVGEQKQATVVDEEQGSNPNLSQFGFEVAIDASERPPTVGIHCFVELVEEEEQALKIPKEFVMTDKRTTSIWIVQKGKAVKKTVKIKADAEDSEMYLLESPISKKTALIFPNESIRAGMAVEKNDPTT